MFHIAEEMLLKLAWCDIDIPCAYSNFIVYTRNGPGLPCPLSIQEQLDFSFLKLLFHFFLHTD